MPWIDKYRFTLTHPVAGSQVVTPLIDDLVVEGKQETRFAWRKKLSTPLLFTGADYDWLYAIETGADRCEEVSIEVEVYCGGDWETLYTGYLKMDDGQWNPVQCRVAIAVSIDDEYSCILEGWKEEKNILNVPTSYTVTGLVGYIEEVTCGPNAVAGVVLSNPPTDDSCLSDANAWRVLENQLSGLEDLGAGTYEGLIETTWVRERVDSSPSMPSGNGWISIGGNSWVRELAVQFVSEEVTTPDNITYFINQLWEVTGDIEFDNARTLGDVLELLNPCAGTYTIQSDFFRINEGALPATDPYNAAAGGFDQIMVWQKSDIVRPNANYNATKGILTFEKAMNYLRNMFNVEWKVEGTVIRIEHISYFEDDNGLDLTAPAYEEWIDKKNTYSYINTQKPKYERFSWMDSVTSYFEGDPIVYDNACANKEENSEMFFRVDEVSTDIAFMNGNEDEIALQGFAMAAVYDDGAGGFYFNTDDGNVNGHLSWTKLHDNYFRHSRPQIAGNMNGADETFDSAIPSKQQEELVVQIECADFLAFDPEQRVQTQIGWGEVSSWSYSAKKCSLTLQILHE